MPSTLADLELVLNAAVREFEIRPIRLLQTMEGGGQALPESIEVTVHPEADRIQQLFGAAHRVVYLIAGREVYPCRAATSVGIAAALIGRSLFSRVGAAYLTGEEGSVREPWMRYRLLGRIVILHFMAQRGMSLSEAIHSPARWWMKGYMGKLLLDEEVRTEAAFSLRQKLIDWTPPDSEEFKEARQRLRDEWQVVMDSLED